MKVECPYCGGSAIFPIPDFIVVDGDILWGECPDCGKAVSIDCIITPNPN